MVLVLAAMGIHTLLTNPRFQFDVVGQYVFSGTIVKGALLTLELTVMAMAIGVVLGNVLAISRMSKNPVIAAASGLYIWFFRGTPVLVQLIFWYNLSAIFPQIGIGIPFGPQLFSGSANSIVTPLAAALLGLGLNEAAYMAEIVRAGIQSVDNGQTEAAHSLGLTHFQTLRKVVLPQAMKVIVPPTGNELISMLKSTSLVSVLAISELLYSAQVIYARTYQTIPLLIVASLWYLALTTVLSVAQYFLERRFGRAFRAASGRPRGFAPRGIHPRMKKGPVAPDAR
ncbi:amino acid ABC transporter permease [Kitasatospora sp. NPDC088351]|uniref:amino acid ABC transporter permease n=1 Tax=unclassified Kitasatospora TaxID=2633591 RepID=UPI0034257C1B